MNAEQKTFIGKVSDWFYNRGIASRDVADFIGCQVALESDFGKSQLAVNHNNYTGMKVPTKRINVANFAGCKFSAYSSPYMCLFDYTLWLTWNRFSSDTLYHLDDFKKKMKSCGYCPESDYITKITNLLIIYKNEQRNSKSE